MNSWKAQGLHIKWVTLMVNDPGGVKPATAAGAKSWRDTYGLNSVYVAPEPGKVSMLPPGMSSFGTPMFTVVDPRTMTVILSQQGAGGHRDKIEALAHKNAAEPEG